MAIRASDSIKELKEEIRGNKNQDTNKKLLARLRKLERAFE